MYLNKYHYASNFEFVKAVTLNDAKGAVREGSFEATDFRPQDEAPYAKQRVGFTLTRHEDDIYSLRFQSAAWSRDDSQAGLALPAPAGCGAASCKTTLTLDGAFQFVLKNEAGETLLRSAPDAGFGLSGAASMFQFLRGDGDQFYGMGEKMLGLELSGKKTKFWNTDVWGDFAPPVFQEGTPDPLYVSVPYLIIKRGNTYVGLLLNNPYATFMSTDSSVCIANQQDADVGKTAVITLGAEMGQPNLIILVGPSLAELTRKLQKVVGCTPRPPVWALGYHQCRWGYQSVEDLRYLDAGMVRHGIPCDGLWLDIDYMDGYRVFTYDKKNFPSPAADLKEAQKTGRRVVPIIDPGVKAESGYPVYDSGAKADIFCRNPQGGLYIGLVWPGETVFPDFSLPEARSWWAGQVKAFAETGITAAWLDMNDPSTGTSLNLEMLFNRGRHNHNSYHNQYALGMAMASREGFQAARPDERPFLLSRSGFIGSSRYTAIWTGDNVSNYHYLKGSIPCTLNLALSGIPFNGPDVCGFGGDTNETLVRDWIKAGFLFPFLRNHTMQNTRAQEPWAFDDATLRVFRRFVQLRYKLRPYLYNLFIAQAERGEAILRPLFYDFADTPQLPLGKIDDQFMVGAWIMQAPFVREGQTSREVVLPDAMWYDVANAAWVKGGVRVRVEKEWETTPIYLREGAVLPMARNIGADFSYNGAAVDFHIVLHPGVDAQAQTAYVFDDGLSYGYTHGKQSKLSVTAKVSGGGVAIETKLEEKGFGDCDAAFVLYGAPGAFGAVTVNGKPGKTETVTTDLAGKLTAVTRVTA